MDSGNMADTEAQHEQTRTAVEREIAAAAEAVFSRLAAAGTWTGDPARVSKTVGKYALSILERGSKRAA
jgi:hypothetical protein